MNKKTDQLTRGIAGVLSGDEQVPVPVRKVSQPSAGTTVSKYIGRGRPKAGQKTGWENVEELRTSIVVNNEKYEKLKDLTGKLGVTIKVLLDEFITDGLQKYGVK